MVELLNDDDWRQAFGYAGESGVENGPEVVEAIPGVGISTAPFTREDVAEVFFADEGEPDGPDWVIAGRLNDGRYFGLRARRDNTGWG